MKYRVIAIEREYASGGQEIGIKLAEKLGVPCYGRQILDMAAKELGADPKYLEGIEEKATGSLMFSMYAMASLANLANGGNTSISGESELIREESEIIRRITQTPAVIVGRCAVDALKDREDVLRVFIRREEAKRYKRAVEVYHIPPENAKTTIRRADKRRSGYYKTISGRDWRDCANYDMVLDSGRLGIAACVEILEKACR